MKRTLIRYVKNLLVPAGYRQRRILNGPLKGIWMQLDLRSQSQVYFGLWEREISPWMVRFAQGARTVVDIGAASGEYTLFALLKSNADRVIAFEPDPNAVRRLHENLRANGLEGSSRLSLHQVFLGPKVHQEPGSSVDELDQSIVTPCLIKMDIDGGEAGLLKGAVPRLLSRSGLKWIIETHSKELEDECISILGASGYSTRIVANAWWRVLVPEYRISSQNRWLIASKEPSEVQW